MYPFNSVSHYVLPNSKYYLSVLMMICLSGCLQSTEDLYKDNPELNWACGDGQQQDGEECDDGNTILESCVYGEKACMVCNAECALVEGQIIGYCGDGEISSDEECDDGNDKTEVCEYGESSCEVCSSDCRFVVGESGGVCGDGTRQDIEECDDGNTETEVCDYGEESCQVCDENCLQVNGVLTGYCGDGQTQPNEECDDGNQDTEVCDYGARNCVVCSSRCQMENGLISGYCGDGVQQAAEDCDDGNNSETDRCLTDCRLASCGDGFVQVGVEQCDDGAANSNQEPNQCRTDCTAPRCGDGTIDLGESCDDGNTITEQCPYGETSCMICNDICQEVNGELLGYCGDTVQQAQESCDDGNVITELCVYGETSCVICNELCQEASGELEGYCGDGIEQAQEECDDGNTNEEDECLSTCEHARCGDGFIHQGVESCEPSVVPNCSDNCTLQNCGDGEIQAGEICDDQGESPTCDIDCTRPLCGDRIVNQSAGEACDDGNLVSGDGCSEQCTIEECGNRQIDLGEACDDGNTVTEECAYDQSSCIICAADCTERAGVTSRCGDQVINGYTEVFDLDFSTNPGFESTSPSFIYWDALNEHYHLTVNDDGQPYWSYSPSFESSILNRSFTFTVDLQPVQPTLGTDLGISFIKTAVENLWEERVLSLRLHWSDRYIKVLMLEVGRGPDASLSVSPTINVDSWYSITINFSAQTQELSWLVVDRATGSTFHAETLPDISIEEFDQLVLGFQNLQNSGTLSTIYLDNIGLNKSIEQCDDGNTQDGDGCSATCEIEVPEAPNRPPPPCALTPTGCPELNFVRLEGGTFSMGDQRPMPTNYELPVHAVTVPTFEIMQSEITVAQYRACVNEGVCTTPELATPENLCNWSNEPTDTENDPINCIDWFELMTFAQYVGARLPTEAEWEFAATSRGLSRLYPWGDEPPTCALTDYDSLDSENGCNGRGTSPVCTHPTGNTLQGLCDMAGNVNEWMLDEWHYNYADAPNDGSGWCSAQCLDDPNPCNEICSEDLSHPSYSSNESRVLRGENADAVNKDIRVTGRHFYIPSLAFWTTGGRLVRAVSQDD